MNIFILDNQPHVASSMLCDKHISKMLLESVQLLCSAFEPGAAPYKRTHYNHPCAQWTRETKQNYVWLAYYAGCISGEYCSRYNKVHKSEKVLNWCIDNIKLLNLPDLELTEFVQCMPDQYKAPGNAVQAYRNYYIGDKARFAKWKNGKIPWWWIKP